MKFKVTYEFRAKTVIEVEAKSREAAEKIGEDEAYEECQHNLTLWDAKAREME